MKRRTVLIGTGGLLSVSVSGCLSVGDGPSKDSDADDGDSSVNRRTTCYDVVELRAIDVADEIDRTDADVAVGPSDERLADEPLLRELLTEAIERADAFTYEYAGDEFEAVDTAVTDADGVSDPIGDLPTASVSGVPPGPIVEYEGRHFVLESETYHQCDE